MLERDRYPKRDRYPSSYMVLLGNILVILGGTSIVGACIWEIIRTLTGTAIGDSPALTIFMYSAVVMVIGGLLVCYKVVSYHTKGDDRQ